MAQREMFIEKVVWDDVADTAVLTLREKYPPAGPEGPADRNWNWYAGPGATVTLTAPIRRAVVTNPTGRMAVASTVAGEVVWTGYEFVNGVWVSLGRQNADGTPYTA